MQSADAKTFGQLVDKVWGLKATVLTLQQKRTYFEALGAYTLQQVAAGLNAHVQDAERGQFLPMPADIIRQIQRLATADGRPGADEAWATAIRSVDESDTVVWTEESALSWAIARPVFDRGDEIGARMAFRDAYNRMVASARERGVAVSWVVSEGFDRERRVLALERAAQSGQLPRIEAEALLQLAGPAPVSGLGDLLSRPDVPAHAREAIARFKKIVADRQAKPGQDGVEKAKTAELKSEAAAKVDAYTKETP